MNILSNYYNRFSCIGGDCMDTCCAGWGINIDQAACHLYQNIPGKFGEYIINNLDQTGEHTMIRMTDSMRCPFLDESGLCRIQLNCGEEYLGQVCATFPRTGGILGHINFLSLSLSCEAVLRLICEEKEPLLLYSEYAPGEIIPGDENPPASIRYTQWAVEYLQDPSIPFSISLGTALYLGINSEHCLPEPDSQKMCRILLEVPAISGQFCELLNTCDKEELYERAETVIFQVTDTFCQMLHVSNYFHAEMVLWEEAVFEYTDEERRLYIRRCLAKIKRDPERIKFMRRLSAALLTTRTHEMGHRENIRFLFLGYFACYITLAAILPLTWQKNAAQDRVYFSRLARVARLFEHSDVIHKYVYPVLQDLFHLDILDYIYAFMVLFGESEMWD